MGTFPPTSATPINGYTPANFGGLVNTDTIGELGQYISGAASWSFVMVLKPTTIVADAGARTNEPALWSAFSGYNGVAISDAGVGVWQYDDMGSYYDALASGATAGTTCVVQARWTGTAIEVRVDNGTWASTSLSTRLDVNDDDPTLIGRDFGGTLQLDADVAEFYFAREPFDDTAFDAIYAALATKYNLGTGITGELDKTLGSFTLASSGAGGLGTLSKTLGDFTLSAAGALETFGTLDKTLGSFTLAAAGAGGLGTLSKTLGDFTVSAAGAGGLGTLSVTLGDFTVSAAGSHETFGAVDVTLDAFTVTGIGGTPTITPVPVAEIFAVVWVPGTQSSPVAWASHGDAVVWIPGSQSSEVAACSDTTTVVGPVTANSEVES